MPLLLWLLACFTEAGPCTDYCDYICECHAGEADFDCDGCRAEYADADPELQDECIDELAALEQEDEDAGHECTGAGDDTAAVR